MSDLERRLAALTPEQRRRLNERVRDRGTTAPSASPEEFRTPQRQSLYLFASVDGLAPADYYSFVLAAARQADAGGLHGIWLPERHFVDFGGFSPNPALLAAAVAATTTSLHVRAGSVAAPLHHPARICEDWAVVDNLSGGRAGISFATGWHPQDFVLAREPYDRRREVTEQVIADVRALWRGEQRTYPSTAGDAATVQIRPAPVQAELPVWMTGAGNPATFEAAGRAGLGIMTGLLGQPLSGLRSNLDRYRAARAAAGHPGTGDVVVMVHAFVSERSDLTAYLRPAMHSYLAAYRGQTSASGADETVLLEEAYQNFLSGPSLLGNAAKARATLTTLADAGVDEVGLLVDFGLPVNEVLESLPALIDVVRPLPTMQPAVIP